jgi:hypothetical protein
VDDDEAAIGTNPGSGRKGNAGSVESLSPRRYRRKRRRLLPLQMSSHDRSPQFRCPSAALWVLHRAAEASLLQVYRAKLAAPRLCFQPGQLAAALARIAQERDVALRALRAKHRSERRQARAVRRASVSRIRRPSPRLNVRQRNAGPG